MTRKILALLLALVFALSLTACGDDRPDPPPSGSGPGRMVRRIEVAIHPRDSRFDRTYVTQENMNELLALLRSMQTDKEPEQEPDLNGGQNYYTITITFANGEQRVYYLLGHTYMRIGNDPWCVIDTDLSRQFTTFLREHPTDDGSVVIETTPPTETTVPEPTEP